MSTRLHPLRRVRTILPPVAALLTACSDGGGSSGDGSGASDNRAPVARFESPATLRPGEAGVFDGFASTDADGRIEQYGFSWGDESPRESSASPRGIHRFAASGTYQVELSVTDDQGGTDSVQRTVVVAGIPVTPDPDGSGEGSGEGSGSGEDAGSDIDTDAGTGTSEDAP